MDRVDKAIGSLRLDGRGLEIGPSYSPLLPKSSGRRVETVDHLSRDELVLKYRGWDLPEEKIAAIEDVDHVWSGGSLLEAIPDHGAYDYVIASHLLEHTVDLVGFLADCAGLLAPGGRLALVLPDKRYSFDLFRPLTTLGDVVDAHVAPTRFHPPGAMVDHQAYACTLAGSVAWGHGQQGDPALQFDDLAGVEEAVADGRAQEAYRDVHRWVFTPASFRLLLDDLAQLGYHRFRVVEEHGTEGFEFFVTLELGDQDAPREDGRDRLARLRAVEDELVDALLSTPSAADRHAELLRAGSSGFDELRARVARLEDDLRRTTAELADVHASTSWRVTSPLRRATAMLRRRG